jgi:hypothetical protein
METKIIVPGDQLLRVTRKNADGSPMTNALGKPQYVYIARLQSGEGVIVSQGHLTNALRNVIGAEKVRQLAAFGMNPADVAMTIARASGLALVYTSHKAGDPIVGVEGRVYSKDTLASTIATAFNLTPVQVLQMLFSILPTDGAVHAPAATPQHDGEADVEASALPMVDGM